MALGTVRHISGNAQTILSHPPLRSFLGARPVQILPTGGKNFKVPQKHMPLSGTSPSLTTSKRFFSTLADLKQENPSELVEDVKFFGLLFGFHSLIAFGCICLTAPQAEQERKIYEIAGEQL